MYLGYLVDVPDKRGKSLSDKRGMRSMCIMNTIASMIRNASIRL